MGITGDVFIEACPSRRVLGRVANKWSLLVIDALGDGVMRNGELLRRIEGVSQKMLTATLRDLEDLNLVERTVFDVVPPHVEYRLTPLGHSFRSIIAEMDRWVENNLVALNAMDA